MIVIRDGNGYAIYAGAIETMGILRVYRDSLDRLAFEAQEDNDPEHADALSQQRDGVSEALEIVAGENTTRSLDL